MDVTEYIKYYRRILTKETCTFIQDGKYDWQQSSYSSHNGQVDSDKRVGMDETWVWNGDKEYESIKYGFENVIKKYSVDFPLFSVQRTTDFRINKYSEGGFMSRHCDNIHHSHGQQYGYPQVTALLYLNDNYEGGRMLVKDVDYPLKQGDIIIMPSCFLFPHEVTEITKGTRYSFVSWAF